MSYVWVSNKIQRTCTTCGGGKKVGTGRFDKWGEEILQSCGTCSGNGWTWEEIVTKTWVDDEK